MENTTLNTNTDVNRITPAPQTIVFSFIIAFIIRIILSFIFPCYKIDMEGFKYWGMLLAEKGFSEFYYSNVHCIYGPGFLYLLWISAKLSSILSLTPHYYEFFIKTWSLLADFFGAYLIYLISKKNNNLKLGFGLSLFYFLNPAVFFDSSIWGQFDSIGATLIFFSIYLFSIKKPLPALSVFVISVLTKPQSAVLGVIILILLFKGLNRKNRYLSISLSFFKRLISCTLCTLLTYTIVVLPFFNASKLSENHSIINLITSFFTFIPKIILLGGNDYPYATANAFNVWTILYSQATTDKLPFIFLTYFAWGNIMLISVIIMSLIIIIKNKFSEFSIYYSCYILIFGTFMFWTKMHERYLVPAVIFAVICILWEKKLWLPTCIMTICCFANQLYLYNMSFSNKFWVTVDDFNSFSIALFTLITFTYSIYMVPISPFFKSMERIRRNYHR